jgi:hypothetical protein
MVFYKYKGQRGQLFIWVIRTAREDFFVTMLSDGSMELLPNDTAAQFKMLLPPSLRFDRWGMEIPLTEMMYPVHVKNISTHKGYFDFFVSEVHGREVTDPNTYMYLWNRFTLQKLNNIPLSQCQALVH